MSVTREEEELTNTLQYNLQAGIGGSSLKEMQEYFLKNKDKLGITEIQQNQPSVQNTTKMEESLTIGLKNILDNSIFKLRLQLKPSSSNQEEQYILDLNAQNQNTLKGSLQAMANLMIQAALKLHPQAQLLQFAVSNNPAFQNLGIDVLKDQVLSNSSKFTNNMQVQINNKLVMGAPLNPVEDLQQEKTKRLNPWSIKPPKPEPK